MQFTTERTLPVMCSDPQEKDGNTFACRRCNDCLATRRADWVSRGMAELAMWKHSYSVTLTYNDAVVPRGYDGARMFAYPDVQDFMRRLRAAACYRASKADPVQPAPTIRFVCAGEQGDQNGRCHWHIILYSDVDLPSLGEITGLCNGKRVVFNKAEEYLTTDPNKPVRCHWSMWTVEQGEDRVPLGFVTFQIADLDAMKYVLSYCLKDQFTEEKSRGTMREAKAENFATGLFRMSKRPALGETFIMRILEELDALGAVLPSLTIRVPGMKHYWQPTAVLREKLLHGLVAINERRKLATGRDAPQWPSLVASCAKNPKALEILLGPEEDGEEDGDLERAIALRGKETARAQAVTEHRRKCGALVPCAACLYHYDLNAPEALTTLGIEGYDKAEGWSQGYFFRSLPGFAPLSERQKTDGGRVNPYCLKRGSKISRQTFPRTDPDPPR